MSELITPEQLPQWLPGILTFDSAPLVWQDMALKGYRFAVIDAAIPTLRDYLIVVYKSGAAEMGRRGDGPWRSERVGPGVVSVLTRAAKSEWLCRRPIEVTHLYLSQAAIAKVASEMFERDIRDIEMYDIVGAEDRVLPVIAERLGTELREGGLGGRLYVDALKNQACIHILRRYASAVLPEPTSYGRFSWSQRQQLAQYLKENISQNISLEDLAGVLQLSVFHFTRTFRADFGCPPHVYIVQERIKQARQLLARKALPLKVVAARSGFSDQSHMTRLFRRFLNVTPAEYRRELLRP